MPGSKKSPSQKDRQPTRPFGSGSNQPVKPLSKPLTRIKSSYIPREPEQSRPIPKATEPKTPKKKVRRELPRRYPWPDGFLRKVEEYARGKFIAITPNYSDMPYFRLFDDDEGIGVLKDIFSRLPTEFQDCKELHWFLTSSWDGKFPEIHIYLIACGIWKFVLRDCKDVEEDNSGAATGESEVARPPATTNNSELLKKPGDKPASRRNELIRESCRKKGWGKKDLESKKWKLRPLMKEIDGSSIPLPRGEGYAKYESYCHLFDDAKKCRSYYSPGSEEASGDDEPKFNDSDEVYDTLIRTLSRGLYSK